MFQTRSLNEEEIENVEHHSSVFFLPESKNWDPYYDAYALNEDSFLDSRGDLMMSRPTAKRTLVDEVYLAAVEAKGNEKVELD